MTRTKTPEPNAQANTLWPAIGCLVLAASCTACSGEPSAEDMPLGTGASAPAAGGSNTVGSGGSVASTGGSGAGGSASGGGSASASCDGSPAVSSKRLVRLSFNQVANTLSTLVDEALGTQVVEDFELVDAEHRAFPPLQSPREGNSFTDQSWSSVDQIAQAAGDYVAENMATVTGCAPEPTDSCALEYLTALAEKAYRHPLSAGESERLTNLYETDLRGIGASVTESIEYGVYAIFQSPQFLYRTEFGMDANAAGQLTQLELASMLSYFLTDDTPDETLMAAAQSGQLSTPAQVGAQVDRILETEAAKINLHGAMMSYFAYPNLENQIIQDDAFTGDMRRSMYREAEKFLDRALWSEQLESLLLSRTAYVNETLAPIYGITSFPPPGASPDEEEFYEIELPMERTGLLTQAGFLANRSRPDHTSVVGRGLLIKNAFLCTETPPPPEGLADAISMFEDQNPDSTERELAEIRMSTPTCGKCHRSFDPYGVALDTYDVLGRYREVDSHGRPIDPSVTLPDQVGGGEAMNIVEVAHKLAESGAFGKCMGVNLINYALADVSAGAANIESCAVDEVAAAFDASDGTFPSLVKAVAMSAAFSHRTQGEAQ